MRTFLKRFSVQISKLNLEMSELPPHRLPPDINDGQAVGGSGAAGGATASQDKETYLLQFSR